MIVLVAFQKKRTVPHWRFQLHLATAGRVREEPQAIVINTRMKQLQLGDFALWIQDDQRAFADRYRASIISIRMPLPAKVCPLWAESGISIVTALRAGPTSAIGQKRTWHVKWNQFVAPFAVCA